MTSWKSDRIGTAERGENPTVLARMRTGWAVIGDTQHLPAYCLLLHAGTASHLTDLPRAERAAFLFDLALLGEAVTTVAGRDPQFARVNYEVLGNSWPHLHGHVHARYGWESAELLHGPVWRYGEERDVPEAALGPRHERLQQDLTDALDEVMADAYAID
ncbi:diadenosine tetraphosphate hydrolase [Streptomyces brevispora]|uniref:diadenosine tetraphosphate hydrolase n=1 Tax=Streptomyces brevispora TaxID=887462 RepID=UPI00371FF829